MVEKHHSTRVHTLELKDHVYRKIGHARAEKYFDHLRRFLSLKLSKTEFDKNCIQAIGRENISLHNRLLRSIIQNAYQAKTPPSKARKVEGFAGVKVPNGYQRSHLQSLYGDALHSSPRRIRSSPVIRDRKFCDRPSPLGPLGKSPSITCEDVSTRVEEQQGTAELNTLGSRLPVEVVSVEDGEEVEQFADSPWIQNRSPITAPFSVSMNMDTACKARRGGFTFTTYLGNCQKSRELPDRRSLMSFLEKKLESEGLGISLDCTNLISKSLDVYLKRLIEPCIGLARSRSTQSINVSMSDFRVAMESNPRILGQDWPIQLEKICTRAFE